MTVGATTNGHGNESDHRNRAGLQIRAIEAVCRSAELNGKSNRLAAPTLDYATDQTDDGGFLRE